ncbi:MAG: O-antigen ligase family protein [Nitrospira sp.]|nr:O-antigen ligase family protein [Nitrospira sp.]
MRYLAVLLFLALLIKDTVPLGETLILRGIFENLALFTGLAWLLLFGTAEMCKRYLLLIAYLVVLLLTMFVWYEPLWVGLQVVSLAAVVVFFIAFVESTRDAPQAHDKIFQWTAYALIIVCIGSLVLYRLYPSLAIELVESEYSPNGPPRFKGLFGKPGMMATASGILLGFCLFARLNIFVRILGILSAFPCLFLTLSRTFWAAAIGAVGVVAFFYLRKSRVYFGAAIALLVLSSLLGTVLDIKLSSNASERIVRQESLTNFSGRTFVWSLALEKFWNSPLLGFGYTLGHHALLEFRGGKVVEDRSSNISLFKNKKFSLHNGYMQALLDSGVIGGILYVLIMAVVPWKLFAYDKERRYGAAMYCILFFSISNGGESTVLAAAMFHSVFYWYLAAIAFSLPYYVHEAQVVEPVSQETGFNSIVSRPRLLSTAPPQWQIGNPDEMGTPTLTTKNSVANACDSRPQLDRQTAQVARGH